MRHPDLCFTLQGRPLLAVEIDGTWHDTPAGRKATDRRNRDYALAGIHLIAVRLSEYPHNDWGPDLACRFRRFLQTSVIVARVAPAAWGTCEDKEKEVAAPQ